MLQPHKDHYMWHREILITANEAYTVHANISNINFSV